MNWGITMTASVSPHQQRIARRVQAEGQGHVLRWLDELDEAQRDDLFARLAELDFDRVRELANLLKAAPQEESFDDMAPAPVRRLPRTPSEAAEEARAAQAGAKALRDDRVAALLVAGGQGTRFNYKPPKGIFPITPVLGKSFFQVHAQKILAARRRYGCRMPWLVMVSPFNGHETRDFFEAHGYFGLGEETVHFFPQPVNVILDADGRMLVERKWCPLMGPDGHGGVFEALGATDLLPMLQEEGFDLISYFQVDNPLATIADERFLGHHLVDGSEFSCKVMPKRDPGEGLGVAVLRSGRPGIVEYSYLPNELAQERASSGQLEYLFGSIAVHLIDTDFMRRVSEGRFPLPWHVARRQYDILDDDGRQMKSEPEQCCKFERFVFDCMPYAAHCTFVEADRASEFAPVKRQQGPDSPATCRAMMRALWLRWLQEAGKDVSRLKDDPGAPLEIGPLFATSAEELKAGLPGDWRPEPPVVLDQTPLARTRAGGAASAQEPLTE